MDKKAADKRLSKILDKLNNHIKKYGYPKNVNRIIIANDAGSIKTRAEKQAHAALFKCSDLMYFTDD